MTKRLHVLIWWIRNWHSVAGKEVTSFLSFLHRRLVSSLAQRVICGSRTHQLKTNSNHSDKKANNWGFRRVVFELCYGSATGMTTGKRGSSISRCVWNGILRTVFLAQRRGHSGMESMIFTHVNICDMTNDHVSRWLWHWAVLENSSVGGRGSVGEGAVNSSEWYWWDNYHKQSLNR